MSRPVGIVLEPLKVERDAYYVYRLWDSSERLLYVGCSFDPHGRCRDHQMTQSWGSLIRNVTCEGPYSRSEALGLEEAAIYREDPPGNRQLRGGMSRSGMQRRRRLGLPVPAPISKGRRKANPMAGIRKRVTSDGRTRYQVRWIEPGVGKQSTTLPTLAAAKTFRAKVEANNGAWPEPEGPAAGPTATEWAQRYLDTRTGITERTSHDYRRDFDRHILPTFGPVPLDLISREQVQAWVRGLEESLAPKTIQNLHGLLSNLLAEAVLARLIPGNPAEGTRLPQPHRSEDCFLTPQEFELIRAAIPNPDDQDLVTVLAGTGLRWGEVSALEPRHVDLLAPIPSLRVEQAWKRQPDSTYLLGAPKTRRSRRTVTLDLRVIDALAGHLTGELVFPGRTGGRYRHANFYRVWQPAVAKARKQGLSKQPRVHDLRHSHVAWLIAAGVSLPKIQHRLGHESITTTIDRYGHLLPSDDQDVRDAMTAALNGPAAPADARWPAPHPRRAGTPAPPT